MRLFTRTNSSTVKKTAKIFWSELRREKKQVIIFSIFIPLANFLYIVLLPLLISLIIALLIENKSDFTGLYFLIAAMIASSVITVVLNHFGFTALFNHEERVTTRLTEKAMHGLLGQSYNFFSNQKVGSLAGDVNTFTRSYLSVLDNSFLQLSSIAVNFTSSLIIIAFIAPILVIPLGLLTGFVIVQSIHSLHERSIYRNKRKELQSKLFGTIADILSNQVLVRLFGKSNKEIRHVIKERKIIEDVAKNEIILLQRSSEVRQSVVFLFQILTIIISIYLYYSQSLSIAALIFTVTYLGRVTGSMFNITSIIRGIEQSFLDASKITEVLDIKQEVVDKPYAKKLLVSEGTIVIKNLSFHYADNTKQIVFHNFNMNVKSGERIGLAGKSGGGKTTLTHLLLRYMDIQSGEILIDGQNIAHVTQESLRNAISYVPQDPFLFHRSLRDNIAYGLEKTSDEEIILATKKAHAYEFINKLPGGLDTIVGERGIKLSGGQRQRIAIARAILKDAPILILDEATSALDSESEKLIQNALEKLMRGRTSIVIAHRLSTIAKLDRIVVLDNGKIIEDGSHTELLAKKGAYATLWSHQSCGFIEE